MAVKACFQRHLSAFPQGRRIIPFHYVAHSGWDSSPICRYSTGGDGNASTSVHPPVRVWCWTQTQQQKKSRIWGFFSTNLTPSFALGIAGGGGLISYPNAVRQRRERAASSPCHAHLYISSSHIYASLSPRFLAPGLSSSSSEQHGEGGNPPPPNLFLR